MKKLLKIFVPILFVLLFGSTDIYAEGYNESYSSETPMDEAIVISGDSSKIQETLSKISQPITGTVFLDKAEITENVHLPKGDYTLSGELTSFGGSIIIPSGARVGISNLTLDMGGGTVNVFGSVKIENSKITADTSMVLCIDSRTAEVEIISGEIKNGSSKNPTIKNISGKLVISGGEVSNSSGVAIYNSDTAEIFSSAKIDGALYEIVTSNVISLFSSGEGDFGDFGIKYSGTPTRGCFTELFRADSSVPLEDVKIYGNDGEEYPIYSVFEDGCYHSGIYLGFKVIFYGRGDDVTVVEALGGDTVTPPEGASHDGYSFDGWYFDEEGKRRLEGELTVSSDTVLYARYSLLAPRFSVSSTEFTYDKRMHFHSVSSISHPLSDEGFFAYEWYRDGKLVSSSEYLRLSEVEDSGSYSLRISFFVNSDSVSVEASGIEVKINKLEIDLPYVEPMKYTGKPLYPSIQKNSFYQVDEVSFIDAGSYTVRALLVDPENTAFRGVDGAFADIPFTVLRADNYWDIYPDASDIYENGELSCVADSHFGEVRYLYSRYVDRGYSEKAPDGFGVYYVKAVVYETENYTGLESDGLPFEIKRETVSGISIETFPEKTVYSAFDCFDEKGLTLRVIYDSGRVEIIDGKKASVSYQTDSKFRYGDNGVVISFGGVSVLVPLTVKRAEYDLSLIDTSDVLAIYNGKYHTYDREISKIVGDDGIALIPTIKGGNTEAGVYDVILSFSSESRDYNTPADITVKMTVFPAIVDVIWEEDSFVYDGSYKSPRAYYVDVFGRRIYPKVEGGATDAGENYKAIAISDDGNYSFENGETNFTVLKADYDLSGVFWSEDEFIYDGTRKNIYISGLPDGVIAIGYTNDYAENAGEYAVTATLSYDKKNYNPPKSPTHTWRILRAEYDISALTLSDKEYVYDGSVHYPVLLGKMPVGCDGISLGYYFSEGALHVSDGRVRVTMYFKTESPNYNTPKELSAYVSILPRAISVVWDGEGISYTGEVVYPRVSALECGIKVSGGGIDAGKYTAFAETDNSDYYVMNNSFEYTVLRAKNEWVTKPYAETSYEGHDPKIFGEANFGDLTLRYFLDEECKNEVNPPLSSGVYFVIVSTESCANYESAKPLIIRLEVIKVAPVALKIEFLKDEFYAFDVISEEDFSAHLINNDGSLCALDESLLLVTYENGNSLRCADKYVRFEIDGFICNNSISVFRADYDLSGTVWEGDVVTFDGTPKTPYLRGLPNGVYVKEYIGGEKVDAGEYEVVAKLSYDSQNYNEPNIDACLFRIEKKRVEYPYISVVYSGEAYRLVSDSPLYTLECSEEYIDAGSYYARIRLTDPENYTFVDTDSEESDILFKILPKTVYLKLEDITLHLFEKLSDTEVSVISPDGIDIETLALRQYREGGFMYIESGNKNYTISYVPAKITELKYPEESFSRALITIFFVLLTFILGVIIIYVYKNKVLTLVAVCKCRWHNRKMSVFPPRVNKYEIKTEEDSHGIKVESDEKNDEPDCCADEDLKSLESKTEDDALEELSDVTREINDVNVKTIFTVDSSRANALISDSLAKNLITREDSMIYTTGKEKCSVSLGEINREFKSGERVDVNSLKARGLISSEVAYIKVTEDGEIDKSFTVYANEFTLSAVKMIALSGGEAIKCITLGEKDV